MLIQIVLGSLVVYIQRNAWLSGLLVQEPLRILPLFDRAFFRAQESIKMTSPIASHMTVKPNCHVRIVDPSDCPELKRSRVPRCDDVGRLVFFKGTVIRTGMVKMLETYRMFECGGCGKMFKVMYDREQYNAITKPTKCLAEPLTDPPCDGNKFELISTDGDTLSGACRDYQEIKVQEQVMKLAVGNIPRSIDVILEDDLVDTCKAGDDIWVTYGGLNSLSKTFKSFEMALIICYNRGTVIRRWRHLVPNDRCEIEIALFANHIKLNNQTQGASLLTDEAKDYFTNFWDKYRPTPILGRNMIIKSFCPKVFGMYIVKLAVMLVMFGGVAKYENGLKMRGDSHILLVGDPGTGKSQFLRYAAQLSQRSVLTTGIGTTSAGLTVTAIKDSGEWQLEAGALVLADRGLCCIDEFGSIREHDKAAIHEAMEQQTISVAKAGLVCKLNSRCSILASTNPKGKYDPKHGVEVNIALASPLLSRFDLILLLMDTQNDDWDHVISSFIIGTEIGVDMGAGSTTELWGFGKLQAYIALAKEKFHPVLSEAPNRIMKKYYQMQRDRDVKNSARTTIRLLESLIRLAQAHAKLLFQDEVTVRDAITAVIMIESSIHSLSFLDTASTLHAHFPENPEDDYFEKERIILERLGLLEFQTAPTDWSPRKSGSNGGGLFTQKQSIFGSQIDFLSRYDLSSQ